MSSLYPNHAEDPDHWGGGGGGGGGGKSRASGSNRDSGGGYASSPASGARKKAPPPAEPQLKAAPAPEPMLASPDPVEGRAIPPNVEPLEPPMPGFKVSKRFPVNKKRQPDLVLGKVVDSEKSQVRGEAHIVNCKQCRCRMKVKKYAVVVRCPDCSQVGLASSAVVKGH